MTTNQILQDLFTAFLDEGGPGFPRASRFRVDHEALRSTIDVLIRDRNVKNFGPEGCYGLTINGLRHLGTEEALQAVSDCGELIEIMKDAYRKDPDRGAWSPADLAPLTHWTPIRVSRLLVLLLDYPGIEGSSLDQTGGVVSMKLGDRILDQSKVIPRLPVANMVSRGGERAHNDEDLRRLSHPDAHQPQRALPAPGLDPESIPPTPLALTEGSKGGKKTEKKAGKEKPKKKGRK